MRLGYSYHVLTRIRNPGPGVGSMLDQVLRLARGNVALMPPSEVEDGYEYSGINPVDAAAGDARYVFLTPFGTVAPPFEASRGKPVLAYPNDGLIKADDRLRVRDLQTAYYECLPGLRAWLRHMDEHYSFDDAASAVSDSLGRVYDTLHERAQLPAREGIPLLLEIARGSHAAANRLRHKLKLDVVPYNAGSEPHPDVMAEARRVVENDVYSEHVEDILLRPTEAQVEEFYADAPMDLALAWEQIAHDWERLIYSLGHNGAPKDLDVHYWTKPPVRRDSPRTSPELLVARPLPVCEAESVLDRSRSKPEWFRLKGDVCASRAALTGIPVGPPARWSRR